MDKFDLLGVGVSAITFDAAIQELMDAPASGRRLQVHFCSVHTLVEASADPTLRDALNRAELVAPDGVPLVWIGRLRRQAMERVCGPDLMPVLIDQSRVHGHSHYFYGGAEGVAERLAETFTERFPGLRVAGTYSPPFRPLTAEEDAAVVARINEANPDYVWVGLGSPKQDHWVAEHRDRLNAAALLAVGAAFDFHGNGLRRAPVWMRRSGLEWLYRFGSEPRRLWRRYTVVNLRFIALLGSDAVRSLVRRARRR